VNVITDGYLSRAWLMEREDGGEIVQPVEPAPATRVAASVESEAFRDEFLARLTT
jgi:hypothetical protein